MLNSIYIDGYKSLRKLKIKVNQGLNVLVGPNGVGKSNIISAVNFISTLTQYSAINAVRQIDNMYSIFNSYDKNKKIHVKLEGKVNVKKLDINMEDSQSQDTFYAIEFELHFNKEIEKFIYYGNQTFELYLPNRNVKGKKHDRTSIFYINYSHNEAGDNKVDVEIDDEYFKRFGRMYFRRGELEKFIKFNLEREFDQDPIIVILGQTIELPFEDIISEISSFCVFDIIPNCVRRDEGIDTEPKIQSNGSGLIATLHNLENSPDSQSKNNFDRIRKYFRLIYPEFKKLETNRKLEDNKYESNFYFIEDESESIPLKYLSDGMVKWLSLITAILTTDGIFAIEEPENYIHPKMIEIIVNLINDKCESKYILVLLTTHSETLIDYLEPKDMIITKIKKGNTSVSRIQNRKLLKEELNNTGFGLGWYYKTGIFE